MRLRCALLLAAVTFAVISLPGVCGRRGSAVSQKQYDESRHKWIIRHRQESSCQQQRVPSPQPSPYGVVPAGAHPRDTEDTDEDDVDDVKARREEATAGNWLDGHAEGTIPNEAKQKNIANKRGAWIKEHRDKETAATDAYINKMIEDNSYPWNKEHKYGWGQDN